MKKKLMLVYVAATILLTLAVGNSFAQRETETGVAVDKDIALLRRDMRSEKKKLIAMNMTLTEAEATKFWPVYDQYAVEMGKVNDEFYAIVREYTTKQKTMTDTQALSFLKRWSEAQQKQLSTRAKHIPLFEKVIPGKKAALFFQVDRRLFAILDLQTVAELPLIIH